MATHMTAQADLDATLRRLDAKKNEWATLPLARKINLMQQMQQALATVDHEAWASDCARCQGMDPSHPHNEREVAVEMLMSVSVLNGHLARLISSFRELEAGARPGLAAGAAVRTRATRASRHGNAKNCSALNRRDGSFSNSAITTSL